MSSQTGSVTADQARRLRLSWWFLFLGGLALYDVATGSLDARGFVTSGWVSWVLDAIHLALVLVVARAAVLAFAPRVKPDSLRGFLLFLAFIAPVTAVSFIARELPALWV